KVVVEDNDGFTELVLKGYDVVLDYNYVLTVKGVTVGKETVITLTANGEPVEGASLEIRRKLNHETDYSAFRNDLKTDSEGRIVTDIFGKQAPLTNIRIRAVKDGLYSN